MNRSEFIEELASTINNTIENDDNPARSLANSVVNATTFTYNEGYKDGVEKGVKSVVVGVLLAAGGIGWYRFTKKRKLRKEELDENHNFDNVVSYDGKYTVED